LEDEDSLTERFSHQGRALIDLAVIRYPRISNFTDFHVFERLKEVSVRYVTTVKELGHPDMVFLPGSKNTMADLLWMRQKGLEAAVKKLAENIPVWGICGGFQMLGMEIADPDKVEKGGHLRGMELLSVNTLLEKEKLRCQREGRIPSLTGPLAGLSGHCYKGYEIHMGKTLRTDGQKEPSVIFHHQGRVYGSYVHGLFDEGDLAVTLVKQLAAAKGALLENEEIEDYQTYKEKQYDRLADTLRACLSMEEIYGMLKEARWQQEGSGVAGEPESGGT